MVALPAYPPTVMGTAQGTGTGAAEAAIELTDEQLDHYRTEGFVIVEDLVSEAELAGLQERLREYTHGGRSRERIKVQVEPRVRRGELSVEHPGDGIRKIDGLVESDDLYQALGPPSEHGQRPGAHSGAGHQDVPQRGAAQAAGGGLGEGYAPGLALLADPAHGAVQLLVCHRRGHGRERLHGSDRRRAQRAAPCPTCT